MKGAIEQWKNVTRIAINAGTASVWQKILLKFRLKMEERNYLPFEIQRTYHDNYRLPIESTH
ncbi:hypothetical protein [Methanohalophilus profundi]|uniref:hypothetical protein n=1 Tax=Methanohalophilus profundi TaxID=2138083 RepID=UPI001CDD257B|nr:hypothetical protein [Methanohalophilus profundi]